MDWKLYVIQGMELLFLGIGSCMDLKDQMLSVKFLSIFAIAGVLCNLLFSYQSRSELLSGLLIGAAVLLIGKFTEEAIGYGDGLTILILGIFEGGYQMFPVLFGAFLTAGIYGIFRIVFFHKSIKDSIPFLPFLFLAFVGVQLL